MGAISMTRRLSRDSRVQTILTTHKECECAVTMRPNVRTTVSLPLVFLDTRGRATNSTGKERDSESGLDNFGARFDSSSFGRFMSPDRPFFDQQARSPQ